MENLLKEHQEKTISMNQTTCSLPITGRLSFFILVSLITCAFASSTMAADDEIVGRWLFPMDQTYTFKNDGTFSSSYVSGTWKYVGMSQKTLLVKYHLYSGGHSETPEVLTLIRGDREGHEYETGHVLRLERQMRVKKLPDTAEDSFSGNSDNRSTETRPSHNSSEKKYDGQVGDAQAVFHLRIEDAKVTGSYSQGDKTYRIRGTLENGRLLLDEYTGERVTAHIKLDPDAGEDSWKGTMYNVYPDKKQYHVTFSRVR